MGLSYTAVGSVNQEPDATEEKIEGSFQIGRSEMAFLQTFSWDYRIKSWSDQVIPGKKNTLSKGLSW